MHERKYKTPTEGIQMELYKGRPDTNEGRLEREIRVYDFLDDHGIEYWRTDHAPADTMEVCYEIDAVLGATICKNLFLCNRQKTQFYLLMMPGDKPFKTKEITSQIGSARLSFASPEDMEKYLDIRPGAVSVMGLMNDHENHVQLLVDEDVMKGEYLGCHPCVNTSSMKVRTEDIFGKFLEAVHHDMIKVTLTGE
jgi:Ala-tRNA(Pro) deacylase